MKEIKLTQGKVALVDDDDFEYLNQWKWYAKLDNGNWYALRNTHVGGKIKTIQMHVLITPVPQGFIRDHKDGNGLNNQRDNIRICTHTENKHNRKKSLKPKTSIFKGVTWYRRLQKWQAQIEHDNKNIYLGVFTSEVDAAKAYDKKAQELFGEFANINFKGVTTHD